MELDTPHPGIRAEDAIEEKVTTLVGKQGHRGTRQKNTRRSSLIHTILRVFLLSLCSLRRNKQRNRKNIEQ